MTEELTQTQIDESRGSWHNLRSYKMSTGYTLTVVGMITGCGLAQMRGVSTIQQENIESVKKLFTETILPTLKACGVGAIICTLGQAYYKKEEIINQLGFEQISEYSNYCHGKSGAYKQRAYILKIKNEIVELNADSIY